MTVWRIPGRAEVRADRRVLEHFLETSIAERIAELPCVVVGEAAAPLSLRIEAWLYRSGRLLASRWPK